VKSASEARIAGLAAVRITWITAIVVCVLAILSGLLAGTDGRNFSQQFPGFGFTDGGNSSQQFPEFASFDPAAALVGEEPQRNAPTTQKTETAGPQGHRGQPIDEQASGPGHSKTGVPHPGSRPESVGGRAPSSAPRPNRPQAPTVNIPKPPQLPTVSLPKPPQAPTVSLPKPSQGPTVSLPKPPQAPTVSLPEPQLPTVSPPEPPQPSVSVKLSQPSVSVDLSPPVQTPAVKVPDVSVQLP
jgi:hypothetical protein